MNRRDIFALSTALLLAWSGWAAADVISSGPVSVGATKVTVNQPPNDVSAGPTGFTGSGTLAVSSQGSGSVGIQLDGTFTGVTATFQGTIDNTSPTWFSIACFSTGTTGTIVTGVTTTATPASWTCPAAGLQQVRVNVTAVATGTATFSLNASAGSAQRPVGVQGDNSNINGINGNTPLTGTGAQGAGSLRTTVATDTATIAGSAPGTAGTASTNVLSVQGIASMTPILANPGTAANWGVGATGSAGPANAVQIGAIRSGATGGLMKAPISCDNHVFKHITTATDTLAVQGVTSQTVYICGWRSRAAGVATWYLENTASTNANCGSTLTQITGVATEAANTGETMLAAFWTGLNNTSGNGLCINSTGTGGVDVDIWYTQF